MLSELVVIIGFMMINT